MKRKMATMNTLESENNKNEAKMHFTCSLALLAALSTFKLPLKGLHEISIALIIGILSLFLSPLQVMEV